MIPFWRVSWWYWGEAAVRVEESEEALEVVFTLLFGLLLLASTFYAATTISGVGLFENVAAICLYITSILILPINTLQIGALWVYITQETEMPNAYYRSEQ